MRYMAVVCEVLFREVCAVAARSVHQVDIVTMPKGLHDIGREGMFKALDEAIEQIDTDTYDAILLVYGLCNNGIVELRAGKIPIVVPRAHDCITLLLGDRESYDDYFHANPGTYYKSPGWVERGDQLSQMTTEAIQKSLGFGESYDEMVEKYGKENADFLMEQLGDLRKNYRKIAYIRTGVEPDDRFEIASREEAEREGWEFEAVEGSLALFEDLLNGKWDESRFLVVPPGSSIVPTHDGMIVRWEAES